jgi:hypothetical protein
MELAMDLDRWRQTLREAAVTFVQADDALKAAAKELKPVRSTHKEHKERVIGLLKSRNAPSCSIKEHNASLKLQVRQAKKAPSKDAIRQRCNEWDGVGSGEELFEFLFRPTVSEAVGLKRVKLDKSLDAAEVRERESEDDMPLQDEQQEEDDE